MSAHQMSMRKLKEVLRLKWACGAPHRQITRAICISVSAFSAYAARADVGGWGLDWTSVGWLSDDELEISWISLQRRPLQALVFLCPAK
jgi:hypothetical protein